MIAARRGYAGRAIATAVPSVRAEILASHDGLVLVPRDFSEATTIRSALRGSGIPAEKGGGGYVVRNTATPLLLSTSVPINIEWTAAARKFAANRDGLLSKHNAALGHLREVTSGGVAAAGAALQDARNLDVLDDHQVISVAAMTITDSPGLCLLDEQGTGKTVVTIVGFDVLAGRQDVDFALVVAPKSMVSEWLRDFERFTGDLYRVGAMVGTRREKRAALRGGFDVLVTNYETAVSMEQEISLALGQRAGRGMLVIDESFLAKNFDAARTRAIRRLREQCSRAFVLCGTPAPNTARDVIEQFNIVDFGITFDGVAIPSDREAARLMIRAAMEARGLYVRNLKRDVMPDLPAKRFTRVTLPFQPAQLKAYTAALDDLIIDLSKTDERVFSRKIASFFARRSALLQICSSPGSVVPGYVETPAKILALDGILDDLITNKREKVVLWSFYTASIDAIMARFARYGPVRYDGTISSVVVRGDAVQRFQEDDVTMLFVGNPAAAGAGLTLHRSRVAVYESLSNQAAHYMQSLDRIHRRGQARDVEYVFLVCGGSIEEQEYARIAAKEQDARDLLGDGANTAVTRDVFMRDAMELRELLNAAS